MRERHRGGVGSGGGGGERFLLFQVKEKNSL
jgi:hypothetical protein